VRSGFFLEAARQICLPQRRHWVSPVFGCALRISNILSPMMAHSPEKHQGEEPKLNYDWLLNYFMTDLDEK
jgi:hypothetical protein